MSATAQGLLLGLACWVLLGFGPAVTGAVGIDDCDLLSRGNGYSLFLTSTEAVVALRQGELRMKLLDANRDAPVSGLEPLPGKVNYILGKFHSVEGFPHDGRGFPAYRLKNSGRRVPNRTGLEQKNVGQKNQASQVERYFSARHFSAAPNF
jgi:hypothetical protein